jgi:flagellar L-ring protein precursor FlgH
MFRTLKMRFLQILAAASCATALCQPLQADSLWARHQATRGPYHVSLVEDSRARKVGDLITIIIAESTAVDNSENKDMRKSTGASGAFDFASSTGGDLGISDATAAFDASKQTARNFSGAATYSNTRAFQDRITVRVVAIDPAGNFVIQGSRSTHISGEDRILNILGVVRSIDIGPDNTLNSQFIYDMQVSYVPEGPERRFTQQGWLSRTMNKVWPF